MILVGREDIITDQVFMHRRCCRCRLLGNGPTGADRGVLPPERLGTEMGNLEWCFEHGS
jgi:hypothetical protein